MNRIISIVYFALLSMVFILSTQAQNINDEAMGRAELSGQKMNELFGEVPISGIDPDPDFTDIMTKFIFADVASAGNLDVKTRELITIVVMTTNQMMPQLKAHTGSALHIGVDPVQIKEAVYQCAPFIGFAKVLNALEIINEVFRDNNIPLPLKSERTVEENERFTKGSEIQLSLYGNAIRNRTKDLPGNLNNVVPTFLTELNFGDFYTRKGLDIKTRELLILSGLATLGGTERQIESHARGNIKAGNDKETIISAMIHCLPHIGFPRALNAIYVIQGIENN